MRLPARDVNVIDAETHNHVSSFNYAFEPPKPPFEDEGQIFLDPLNPQTAMSPAFLELTADMVARDRGYHDRLVRHYTMWKRIVDDPSHPGHEKLRAGHPGLCVARSPKSGPTTPVRAGAGASVVGRECHANARRTHVELKARFRRQAFGWKSHPAIVRIREAVSEIKQVARTEPIDAAQGAVTFIERLSRARERRQLLGCH